MDQAKAMPFQFAQNSPVSKIDYLGLVVTTCDLWKKTGKMCTYKCVCPPGTNMGFTHAFTTQPCDWALPTRTCVNNWWAACVVAAAVVVSQLDSPVPGPADACACGILVGAGLLAP